jgi:hypothetical protein
MAQTAGLVVGVPGTCGTGLVLLVVKIRFLSAGEARMGIPRTRDHQRKTLLVFAEIDHPKAAAPASEMPHHSV